MRQIIPFKKELLFKTKISEITSISLEHTLHLATDNLISGEFHISGDYKMTEASINREKFNFTLPFEIDLDSDYIVDTTLIDIDNFYYEVVNDDSLQVNIDVFVDGEKKEIIEENVTSEVIEAEDGDDSINRVIVEEISDIDKNVKDSLEVNHIEVGDDIRDKFEESKVDKIESDIDVSDNIVDISSDISDDVVSTNIIDNRPDNDNNVVKADVNDSFDKFEMTIDHASIPKITLEETEDSPTVNVVTDNNFNFFNTDNFGTDTYVTYYVYIVKEDDTIDKIMEKFNVSKDELTNYNDISNVSKGTKLIIPTSNE